MRASQAKELTEKSFNEKDLDQTFETIKQACNNGNYSVVICGGFKDVEVRYLQSIGYNAIKDEDGDLIVSW